MYSKKSYPGNLYHVLNRGVDKRIIFIDKVDYLRFIRILYDFNNIEPVSNFSYFFAKQKQENSIGFANRYGVGYNQGSRKVLVDVLAFVLMPNHYHLLLKPRIENGVTLFMKKINIGYANYFNKKYERSGALFQGRYKSVIVTKEAHFIHLPYYIHANPLDLVIPEWRDGKVRNPKKAMDFLKSYRWSSFSDYIGRVNFPLTTQRDFLLEFVGGTTRYKINFSEWLRAMDMDKLNSFTLE